MNVVSLLAVVVLVGLTTTSVVALPDPFIAANYTTSSWYLCSTGTGGAISVHRYALISVCQPASTLIANESYSEQGWDFIQVNADPLLIQQNATEAYYLAGYLEGYVTAVRISEVMPAFNCTAAVTPPEQVEWVTQHLEYMYSGVGNNTGSRYWQQLGSMLAQIRGIADGYAARRLDDGAAELPPYSFLDLFLLNFAPELSDVAGSLESEAQMKQTDLHCSGYIKVTDDDLFMAHASWSSYSYMVRQYKVYNFEITVAMSSCAGTIASGDDWYITSNGLGTLETTNGFYNASLNALITPFSVSEFLRAMIGNYVATSGQEWVALFQQHNSGTYNNQWMIVDFKRYNTSGDGVSGRLQDNLLWVAEQIPGNVTSADVTYVVRDTTYWASYNTPFFPNIYNISGYEREKEKYGSLFSYSKYARPEMFKRNSSDVTDLPSMRRIMRYNKWQTDPLSVIPNCTRCDPPNSPMLAIASRGDLVESNFTLPSNSGYAQNFEGSAFGAIDAKIASYKMMMNRFQGNVICGPTTDDQVPFRWSFYQPGGAPPASPDLYNFSWTFYNNVTDAASWQGPSWTYAPTPTPLQWDTADVAGFVVATVAAVVLGAIAFQAWRQRCRRDNCVGYTAI